MKKIHVLLDSDPDETKGREIYHYKANVQACFDVNIKTRKPRLNRECIIGKVEGRNRI